MSRLVIGCVVVVLGFGTALAQDTAQADGLRAAADERLQLALGVARPNDDFERYTGVYLTSAGTVLIVVAEEQSLTIERGDDGEPPVRLFPALDRGTFSSEAFTVVFARAADGSVTGLRVSSPSGDGVSAVKAPPRRGIVIIEDVIEKAGGHSPPVSLPDLPMPGANTSWSAPFAAVVASSRSAHLL